MTSPSRSLTFLILAVAVVLIASCDSSDPSGSEPPPAEEFDRSEMLEHLGRDLILPAYESLKTSVDALEASASAFADDPSPAALETVRDDLKAARLAWQEANLYQFGPAESLTLRSSLNTYPTDTDKIAENVASGSYTLGTIDNRAAAGLPALDYLLHGLGATDEDVVSAYTEAENASARLTYLLDNVDFIREAVDGTLEDWTADGGDYIGTFLSEANAGTDVGSSLGMLINAFVMHYERFMRDGKIGIPAGVRSAGVPRPTSTEAYYAGYSAELAVANVQALRRLFLGNDPDGGEGIGLDDNLVSLDAEALAVEIETQLDEALVSLEGLNDPLSEQIESDNEPVLDAFTELQEVVVLLKADMTSILGITITYQDTDGD